MALLQSRQSAKAQGSVCSFPHASAQGRSVGPVLLPSLSQPAMMRSLAPSRVERRSGQAKMARRSTVLVRAAAGSKPWKKKDCRIVLEDGSVWWGTSFGAKGTTVGEVRHWGFHIHALHQPQGHA